MEIIKNFSKACTYIAFNIKDNNSLKNKFQDLSLRSMSLYKKDLSFIKDSFESLVTEAMNLTDIAEVDMSMSVQDSTTFKQGCAKILEIINSQNYYSVPLSSFFDQSLHSENLKSLEIDKSISVAKVVEEVSELSSGSQSPNSRDRKQRILTALSKQASGLKELRELIPNVNDKSLQRDLNDLIRDRRVLRMGSKRWAKYYLK